ncbi:hypothetical protein [Nocardia neocaledoniensis]|uniref:hypothetical protein n=1 Tax=Nocardia neocaledoniensis TaxID=236511 RepID=UPI0024544411|nr:hypothetical protein [Nocardia neocaledoniensis]
MTRMIGYFREALVHPDDVLVVEHQLQRAASAVGAPLLQEEIKREPAPTRNPLWSLMETLDRRHDTMLVRTVTDLAARDRVDLRPLMGGPASYRVLWAAVEQLHSGEGGYIVVPSMTHLEGLVVSRPVLMRQIADLHPAVGILDASNADHLAVGANTVVIGEFQVPPVPLAEDIASTNARARIGRAGLADLAPAVDLLVRKLVGTVTEKDHFSGQGHLLTIRIHRDLAASTLVVTCLDTRDFAEVPPHRAVVEACAPGRIARTRWGTSGTATRCELLLPGAQQSEPLSATAR